MARKPVVELAQRQMERNLGYWVLRICKLSSEHPLPPWEHGVLDSFLCRLTEGDKVSVGPCLQLCRRWRMATAETWCVVVAQLCFGVVLHWTADAVPLRLKMSDRAHERPSASTGFLRSILNFGIPVSSVNEAAWLLQASCVVGHLRHGSAVAPPILMLAMQTWPSAMRQRCPCPAPSFMVL